MLIEESHKDVPTKADGDGNMRIFLFHPKIPNYPHARFPAVVLFSEIYQVTGPVARFARQMAGHGYIVAAPSSYHEFTGPEPLAYDGPGTDEGNQYKIQKKVAAYDEDAALAVTMLLDLPTCNGRVGATGMCLGSLSAGTLKVIFHDHDGKGTIDITGNKQRHVTPAFCLLNRTIKSGHLAFRAAFDTRVAAAVCYFATDIHSHSLGAGKNDDSLQRAGEIRGEIIMIHGKSDPHVPAPGRDLIRTTLHEKNVTFSFYEIAGAQHAFIRDELSKGRYDPYISNVCFSMLLELFGRVLRSDLGKREGGAGGKEGENVC